MKATATRENLNQRGPTVDAEILSYLKTCADRNQDGWASPPLIDIARMAQTSVFVVQECLCHFTRTGMVVEETRTVGGMEEVGWIVPRRKKRRRRQTAAGFGSGDLEFLRQCGVKAED